ncbi:hypothetical protein M2322_001016 [Rhodoblastus acidophilus]|nr:hypothetical protein [Rhodoblastus acidophilus]MCW2315482.1 hypothetical protein [Rhodoblastus acidophilus]
MLQSSLHRPRNGAKFMSDVIFISLGLALIGLTALYARALTHT